MPTGLPSASEFAMAMRGLRLPATKDDLVTTAEKNGAAEKVVKMLRLFPNREYNSASDVSKGLHEVDTDLRAKATGISASEVAKNIAGIHFPADKRGLLEVAKKNGASSSVLAVFDSMTDRRFNSITDVGREIRTAKNAVRDRLLDSPPDSPRRGGPRRKG